MYLVKLFLCLIFVETCLAKAETPLDISQILKFALKIMNGDLKGLSFHKPYYYYYEPLSKESNEDDIEMQSPDNDSEDELDKVLRAGPSVSKNVDMSAARDIRKAKVFERTKQQKFEKQINEIVNLLKSSQAATNYLYEEIQRIKRTGIVKDEIRELTSFIEKYAEKEDKSFIMGQMRDLKKYIESNKKVDVWKSKTNNLVINWLKSPYQDGVSK